MDSDAASDRTPHAQTTAAPRRWARGVTAALALMVLLAACGSSPKPATTSAQVEKQTCQQVEAALSDGPDPEADPVGHAQAQVLPLRQIHTTDGALHQAIDSLAAAYQAFSSTNGASQSKSAVSTASKTIERLCPGIES
jgi:predicted component of type VI protein secretion system